MRRPKHLRDLRLLDDEPFVTQFPRIRDATLQETRTSRSAKKTFKNVATPFILEKLRSNPDAAAAWLKLAFVAADWDEGCVQPSIDDDDALLLFAEYYYHYFRSGKYVARQFLFEARKQRGFGGYISDTYDASDEDEGDQNDEVLQAKQIEDDDATAAHALDLNTLAKRATLSDSSILLSAESVHSIDAVPITIADGNKKRKAENERPSSDSSSHVMNGPSETRITGLADFDSSLSELTESSEELSPLTSIPKPVVSKPNPQQQSVSAPIARAKPKKPKKQAHALPVETPSRILPSRQASNRQNLSAMMEKEARYQQEKPLGREISLEPTILSVPSRVPEVNPISERKLSKKAKRVKTRKEKRRANKSIAPALHDESGPTIPPGVIQNPHPNELPAPPCTGDTSLPKPTRSSRPKGKEDKGRLKAKFLQSKEDPLAAPPSKKRRGHDGPIMDQPILLERTRATTRTKTLVSKAAASVQLSQPATRTQEPIPQVSGTSESISAPLTTTKGKGPKNSKKRSLATMEDPTQESHPPEPSIALNTEKTRTKAPLPKHRSKKSAKPLPLPPTPSSVADVDSVLRSAGAEGSAYLAASSGQGNRGSTEWEGVHTPAAQIPDESSSEEDVPLRTIIEKRIPVAAETLTPAVVAEPDANDESTLNNVHDMSKEITQDIDLSLLQDIPIKHDPIDLPEKPMQVPLPRLPPIWAESRQEVCEAFDYFRSYQGGVYFIKDIVKGYLLGGFSASRDVFRHNGKLIISHGGGKAESIHKNHGHSEAFVDSDQKADDKSVRALLTTFALQRPLALIIDDKYAWFPYNLASRNCTYAVLGFYRIVNAWAERQYSNSANEYVVRYKFAFQWCEEQGEPWWIPQVSDHEVVPNAEQTVPDQIVLVANSEDKPSDLNVTWQCPSCHKKSPQVYAEGWMCLQPSCRLFWKLSGKDQPTTLHYSNSFLQLQQLSAQELPDLRPPPPTDNVPDDGVTTTYHFTRGWHCRECGRLSSRFKWEHWQCKNCGNIHDIQGGRYRSAREFRHQLEAKQFSRHSISPQSGIVKPFTQGYSYGTGHSHYVTFILPKARGYIHLIFSAPAGNAKADKILEDYQREAAEGNLKFRRWPMRAHKCKNAFASCSHRSFLITNAP
ncbi:hypothetical protein QCA50_020203 [Cerrena zonata]|uniref:Uncharacterized protein n=1 Tax=Cerrena zonata TaxID=2478898 RepID=A0AAW0FAV4_9APHY